VRLSDLAEVRAEMGGLAGVIQQRGAAHLRAQSRAYRRQPRGIGGERGGVGYVLRVALRDPLGVPNGVE